MAALAGLLAGLAGPVLLKRDRDILAGRAVAIDGDSLRVGGSEIRLAGIDAPELAQTCRTQTGVIACGREARSALAALVSGREVRCESDGSDPYGRRLARCRAGEQEINAALVRGGQAINTGPYAAEQAAARREAVGLWKTAFDLPVDWRATHPREAPR
jgi:endonuclease YncB( thermonuclease family)